MNILGKSFYITTGLILTVVGGLASWQSMEMYQSPVKKVDLDELRTEAKNACYNKALDLGFDKALDKENPDVITAYKDSVEDWKASVYAASTLVSECDGMVMQSFCMGTECKVENSKIETDESGFFTGVYMTLKYDKSTEVILIKK